MLAETDTWPLGGVKRGGSAFLEVRLLTVCSCILGVLYFGCLLGGKCQSLCWPCGLWFGGVWVAMALLLCVEGVLELDGNFIG